MLFTPLEMAAFLCSKDFSAIIIVKRSVVIALQESCSFCDIKTKLMYSSLICEHQGEHHDQDALSAHSGDIIA